MHGGEHGNYVGTLEPTTVSGEQVEEIPWGDAGVEGVRVSETPDPSVFNDLEDEGPASHFADSDEQLGGEPGGPFAFHIFSESVGGIVFDAGVIRLVGVFVGRIGED